MAELVTGYGSIEMPDADYEAAQQRKRDAAEAMNRPASDRIMDTPFDPQRVAERARPFMGETNEQREKAAQDRVAAGMGSDRDYRTAAGSIFAGPTAVGQDSVPSPGMQQARAEVMNTRTQEDLRRDKDLRAALEQSQSAKDQKMAEINAAILQESVKSGQVRPKLNEAGNPIAGAFEGIEPERKPIMPGTDGDMIFNPTTGRYEFRARQMKQDEPLKPAPGGQPVVQHNGMYGTWDPKLGMYTNWKPIPKDVPVDKITDTAFRDIAIMQGKGGAGMDASLIPQMSEVMGGGAPAFNSVAEAAAAGLAPGTIVIINGRKARIN